MPVAPDHIGAIVGSRYELVAVIGEGGFGRVYRAWDRRLEIEVAVKVIYPWWAQDSEWVDRFSQEARTAAKIRHHGVVAVTDAGVDERVGPYTVSELISGRSLRAFLDDEGPLDAQRAVGFIVQAADALSAAHARGIVHRDVKPSNLLIDDQGRLRVCDFGIARLQSGATHSSATHTTVGTPTYMAPEQAQGQRTGPPADQYSLAVVLHELLTGTPPFTGDTPVALAMAHLSQPPPPPPPETPRNVASALRRALSKDPADRYPTIAGFAAALADDAPSERADTTQTAPTLTTRSLDETRVNITPSAPSTRRRRVLPAIGVVIAFAVAAGGLLLATRENGTDPSAVADTTRETAADTAQPATSAQEPPARVRVPRLIGLPVAKARARAERRGLEIVQKRRHRRETPRGVVASQAPAPGQIVSDQDTVAVVVSAGPPPATVPSVRGEPLDVAQRRLQRAGLTSTVRAVPSDKAEGTVLNAEPPAGTTVDAGGDVTLTVARAKSWQQVATYSFDSDGATPSIRIRGSRWRITYTANEIDCEFTQIDCSPPELKIERARTFDLEFVSLSPGTHTTYGPDGPGRFRIAVASHISQWSVQLVIEEFV